MTLEAGRRLGSYEIVGPIGAGGMREVYRASDTSLRRDVNVTIDDRGGADVWVWNLERGTTSCLGDPLVLRSPVFLGSTGR